MAANVLTDQLVTLLRARQLDQVLLIWQAAPAVERESESAKRTVAAALAQGGNLPSAYQLLAELAARPDVEPTSLLLAGRVAFDLGEFPASVEHFSRLVSRDRDNVDAWRWLADAALRAHEPDRALRGAEVHALRFVHDAELAIRFASLLALSGRCDEALIAFERILARWPGHAVAGPAFAEFVMREFPLEAADLLDRNNWLPADNILSPALVRALLWMPAWYASSDSALKWRERLLSNLHLLRQYANVSALVGDGRAHCLATTPFFAAYHDADVTQIQFAWGDFVEALVSPLRDEYPCVSSRPTRIRKVGFVTNRATDSSAGRFFNPWLTDLAAAGFEVTVYAIGSFDHITDGLSARFRVHRFPVDDVVAWRPLANQLRADANDVLIYPEPQGSQLIQLIAGIRFAPVQCAAFGNPLTTGLQSMDYFFVPDDAEVSEPESYYRERVIRLSGLGISVPDIPGATRRDRSAFGFKPSDRVVLVSQQLQKWTPEFVRVVVSVLERDPSALLVYFAVASGVSVRAFEVYLRAVFSEAGMSFSARTLAVGMLSRADYLSLHACADVALDTFGFSGGSSTLDAVAVGLPVVSIEGRYLRGRQSAAMLRAGGQGVNVVHGVAEFEARVAEVVGRRPEPALVAAPSVRRGPRRETVSASVAEFLRSL